MIVLARPRRFGKSLMCNTLRAYFEGKKHLFEDLKIYQWEKEWTAYPIIYIDFVSGDYTESSWTLVTKIRLALQTYEDNNGIKFDPNLIKDRIEEHKKANNTDDISDGAMLSFRAEYDLMAVYNKTGLQTVILVDEYDNTLIKSANLEKDKNIYRGFFSILKSSDKFLRFVFMTGITKFAKTSIFSGTNQPYDLTLDMNYSAICGITHKELADYFTDNIKQMAESKNKWRNNHPYHKKNSRRKLKHSAAIIII
ncbi:MAG: AAA family ATPase [Bacteroidales bacterium]|nr:AAA family ATPase [Bacteroidales bacterium]